MAEAFATSALPSEPEPMVRGPRRPGARARTWRKVGRYALLTVVAAIVLTPIYVTLVGAFKPGTRVLDFPSSLVPFTDFTLDTFREAWDSGNLGRLLVNSFIQAGLITLAQVVTSIMAAYAFAFLRLPAKALFFGLFVATLMIPTEVTIIVNYDTISALGWVNTMPALVVPFLAAAFGTFLIRQVFLTVPRDLRDAAAIDGLGHWRFCWQVAVPVARPTIAALAVFSFLLAFNQYLWPLLVTDSPDSRTIQVGLRSLAGANIDKPNLVMAGTIIAALPIFVLLLVFQRQLVRGLTAGAVKG